MCDSWFLIDSPKKEGEIVSKKKYSTLIFVLAIAFLTACNNDQDIKNATSHKITESLSLEFPAEWESQYIIERSNIDYFDGDIEYPAPNVIKTSFKLSSQEEQMTFLDIITVPKGEIMNYLNWGMEYQFFLGHCDDYYYFSSGSFGLSEEDNDKLQHFTPDKVESIIKMSFDKNNVKAYWEFILHDPDTIHGRNDKLPFEMNIRFLYDIKGDYKFTDESGEMPIEEIIDLLLLDFANDLSVPRDNWRFTINRCEVFPYDIIYDKDNFEMLEEDFDLQDFYINGDLDEYLNENFWIFVSGCKVFDFQGFIPLVSSREFHQNDMEYVGAEAGVWVVEKQGNTYHMYRPDIPFLGQGA